MSDFRDEASAPPVTVDIKTQRSSRTWFKEESESSSVRIDNAQDLSINADDVGGGVVINLIDNVLVAVRLPKITPSAYLRIALYQALQDYRLGLNQP